jgi:hypothetical protein
LKRIFPFTRAKQTPHPDQSFLARNFFALALIVGTAARIYCFAFTAGTYDVAIWQQHAVKINEIGLTTYYRQDQQMNHPPLISLAFAFLLKLSASTGIPFRVLLRAPFAVLDLGTTLIMALALKDHGPWGRTVSSCYYIYPLSIIYSSYHGNTDTGIAFFLVLASVLVSRNRYIWAAIACGFCLNIKLPVALAIPALMLAIRDWRFRVHFLGVIAAVWLVGYLPWLVRDPVIVLRNVVYYQGQVIRTTAGLPVWGGATILWSYHRLITPYLGQGFLKLLLFWFLFSSLLVLILVLVISILRRDRSDLLQLFATVNAVYTVFYGFTNFWSFQYFAWSLPFWFTRARWFSIPAFLGRILCLRALLVFVRRPNRCGTMGFRRPPTLAYCPYRASQFDRVVFFNGRLHLLGHGLSLAIRQRLEALMDRARMRIVKV